MTPRPMHVSGSQSPPSGVHSPGIREVKAARIDKWLWAVRVFKTRTAAAEACKAGHVKISGHPVKPARSVHVDEVILARSGDLERTVKVLGMIERRVGAKLVAQFMEDMTSPAEYEKARQPRLAPVFLRPKGAGRPTKKERRALTGLRGAPTQFGSGDDSAS